ncbi:MAG TPA: hypothetical protein VFK52_05585 [Nocardioidaceae bacterium]|nr:hypothetical protein [Nocardioidaceae bacterium]
MDLTVISYLAYLAIAIPVTVWVATELSRNGHVFLADVFGDKDGLAAATNKLLLVGFYLVNVGFVLLFLKAGADVRDVQGLIERLSVKLGVVLLALGMLHLLNVLVFSSIREGQQRRARLAADTAARYAVPHSPRA